MSALPVILAASVAVRAASLALGAWLSWRLLARYAGAVAAMACGLLLSLACMHLIPEAFHMGADPFGAGASLLAAMIAFIALETVLARFAGHSHGVRRTRPVPALLGGGRRLVAEPCCPGDRLPQALVIGAGAACHNFVDGILLAAAFAADMTSGMIVSLAMLAHEVPQATSQLAILEHLGQSRGRATGILAAAAAMAVAGSVAGWAVLSSAQALVPYALLVSAASFLYIVLAVLAPQMSHAEGGGAGMLAALVAGAVLSQALLAPLHAVEHEHGGQAHAEHAGHGASAPKALK
ncbi:MAG: ZIP family metal transporter [Duodenibacillus sp.]|nr:ZIP family metal transporter [Duodenibacillus sp.]